MGRAKLGRLRKEIIRTCLEMNRLGINQGRSGNVSTRTEDGFLITPSGIAYEAMSPEQVVFMDLDGGYYGPWLPSSEWRLHLDIYRSRPDAGAVVHAHSVHATALSCLRRGIPAFHYMVAVAGGADLRCADYATFGTADLSAAMLVALEGRSACLLANHGQVAIGDSLSRALDRAIEVETLARQYILARQLGEPVILDAAEMARVLARFAAYGKQAKDLAPGEIPAFEHPRRRDA
jgi:L-fuculose-phosphate aldolase